VKDKGMATNSEKQNRKGLKKLTISLIWWSVFRGILRKALVQMLQKEYLLIFKRRVICLDISENLRSKIIKPVSSFLLPLFQKRIPRLKTFHMEMSFETEITATGEWLIQNVF